MRRWRILRAVDLRRHDDRRRILRNGLLDRSGRFSRPRAMIVWRGPRQDAIGRWLDLDAAIARNLSRTREIAANLLAIRGIPATEHGRLDVKVFRQSPITLNDGPGRILTVDDDGNPCAARNRNHGTGLGRSRSRRSQYNRNRERSTHQKSLFRWSQNTRSRAARC